MQHQELILPGEQERAAGGQLGAGCKREVMLGSGCASLDVGQYQGLASGSKGSGLQGEDAGQKEGSKGTQ